MSEKPVQILHVEDDSVDAMVVKQAFKKCGITNPVIHAHDGAEALEILRGENGKTLPNPLPAIILLDINMPRMNGIEFLRELRNDEHLKTISVFMLTTSNDESDKAEAYKHNVAGYVLKPVSLDDYVSTISKLDNFWKICVRPEAAN